jgi:hypothetical protein
LLDLGGHGSPSLFDLGDLSEGVGHKESDGVRLTAIVREGGTTASCGAGRYDGARSIQSLLDVARVEALSHVVARLAPLVVLFLDPNL